MADEREGAPQAKPDAASKSKIQTGAGAPGEERSFDPRRDAAPRQDAGEATAPCSEGLLGPRGDPAEGKR